MKHKHSIIGRVLRGTGIFLGAVILLLYIGLPVGMGIAAVLPARASVGSPPDGFSEVSLTTTDGVELRGWYHPPANGAAILLLHGAGGSRDSLRPQAELLAGSGYGVLALDLRGHGQSQGRTNRLGWEGTLDVGAAVRFLEGQPGVEQIGGLGSSMGGEVLLGAAVSYPALKAIAADGATRRCTAEYLALAANRPLARSFTTRVMYTAVQILSGDQPPFPLLQSMELAKDTRFLLIAAGNNRLETDFNRLFAASLGTRSDLWLVPGADHTQAYSLDPDEYGQRVLDFFDAVFIGRERE